MLPFEPLIVPKKLVVPAAVPMARLLLPRFTLELTPLGVFALVSEATSWLKPPMRFNCELPRLPASSIVTAERPLAMGRALVALALRMPLPLTFVLRMKVGPL